MVYDRNKDTRDGDGSVCGEPLRAEDDVSLVREIAKIEDLCEWTMIGPSRSFFEIEGRRYIYVTHVYVADLPSEALVALRHCLTGAICGEDWRMTDMMMHKPGLFWRLPEKIVVEQRPDGRWMARTRVVVVRTEKEPV